MLGKLDNANAAYRRTGISPDFICAMSIVSKYSFVCSTRLATARREAARTHSSVEKNRRITVPFLSVTVIYYMQL